MTEDGFLLNVVDAEEAMQAAIKRYNYNNLDEKQFARDFVHKNTTMEVVARSVSKAFFTVTQFLCLYVCSAVWDIIDEHLGSTFS